jgi:hypothetical protein
MRFVQAPFLARSRLQAPKHHARLFWKGHAAARRNPTKESRRRGNASHAHFHADGFVSTSSKRVLKVTHNPKRNRPSPNTNCISVLGLGDQVALALSQAETSCRWLTITPDQNTETPARSLCAPLVWLPSGENPMVLERRSENRQENLDDKK